MFSGIFFRSVRRPRPLRSNEKNGLEDRVKAAGSRVLITGAAKRVGAELARTFASAGAHVLVHCNRSREEAERLVEELGGEKAGHGVVCCDLSSPENLPELMEQLPEDLSVLVNNASVFLREDIEKESLESAERQFAINFWSPVELMRLFFEKSTVPELSVVNLLDQAIRKTPRDSFSYLLSKKSLAEATRAAALHYAPRMRVNGLAPGPVFPPPGLEHLRMEKTLKTIPLGRPVNPNDLAEACLFLAMNSSITGETLFVDCGQSLL